MRPADDFPRRRRVLRVLAAFVLAMVAWAFVGELDVVVSARGRVVSDGRLHVVQAPAAGLVDVILVREGDAVRAGQVLAHLDTTASRADVDAATERRSQLAAELSRLLLERDGAPSADVRATAAAREAQHLLQQARLQVHEQRQHEARALVASRASALAAGLSTAEGLRARLAIAREKVERARAYVDVAVPRFQFLQWQDDLVVLEKDLQAQEGTNRRLREDEQEARQKALLVRSERTAEIAQDIAAKQSRLAELDAELRKLQRRVDDAQVRSAVAGVVQRTAFSRGGVSVGYGETLFVVAPSDAPLVMEVDIPNADKGFLRIGQDVDIKLDAFPFQRYGRVHGELVWISPDADRVSASAALPRLTAAELAAPATGPGDYVYRGKVRVHSGAALPFAPGMTAQVDIFTDRRRVIDFFMFPVARAVEEGVRVR